MINIDDLISNIKDKIGNRRLPWSSLTKLERQIYSGVIQTAQAQARELEDNLRRNYYPNDPNFHPSSHIAGIRFPVQGRKVLNAAQSINDSVKKIFNLDKSAYAGAKYNPTPGSNIFQRYTSQGEGNYLKPTSDSLARLFPRQFTTLDIETDDLGRPITISALKTVFNKDTKQFEIVDNYQRFYESRNRDLKVTSGTHGLTAGILHKLRKQQYTTSGTLYGRHYNDTEMAQLKEFLGSSVVVGHNIVEFDLPHLFPNGIQNQTIDTLVASRNQWHGKKNDLDSVFKRMFGMSMEQAGLPHHDSMSDVIANAMIAQKMMTMKGDTGKAIRHVAGHAGYHIAPREEFQGKILNKHGRYVDARTLVSQLSTSYNFQDMEAYMKDDINDFDAGDWEELMGAKESADLYDPESGGMREGFHYTGEGEYGGEMSDAVLGIAASLEKRQIDLTDKVSAMIDAFNSFNFWKKSSLTHRIAQIPEPVDEDDPNYGLIQEELSSAGFSGAVGGSIVTQAARLRKYRDQAKMGEFVHNRDRRIERAKKHGLISEEQGEELKLTKSYEELEDAMDDMILKNQKLEGVLKSIASIPMYNFDRLEQVAKKEMGGIFKAASGVIPEFLLRPSRRLGDAFFNDLDSKLANVRGVVSATSAIAPAIGGVIGSVVPGVGTLVGAAAGGVIGGISQIYGNYKEAQVTRIGEGIQNNLNTLGFFQEMILMPFRLLKQAINSVVKAFGVLTGAVTALRHLMVGGLSSLQNMGNPLSQMTGVDYGSYFGSKMADAASLLSPGTLNAAYEDFAKQQQQLYTTGKLDTNRLVAASMLGVFDNVYGPTDNWEKSFATMVNKLAADIKQNPNNRQQTYMLANTINPALGSVLQTMNTLGISRYEDLSRPKNIFMRSQESISGWRPGWQKAQWEYQAAGSQWGVTKGRIATSLWNTAGRPIYNIFNRVMDSVANAMESGKWSNIIDLIKAGATELWSTIKNVFGLRDAKSLFGSIKDTLLDGAIKVVEFFRTKVVPVIFRVWDSIASYMIDKFTGLATVLSTFRIDFQALLQQITTGRSSKPVFTSIFDTKYKGDAVYEDTPFKELQNRSRNMVRAKGRPELYFPSRLPGRGVVAGIESLQGQDISGWINKIIATRDMGLINEVNSMFLDIFGFNPNFGVTADEGDINTATSEFMTYLLRRNKYGEVPAGYLSGAQYYDTRYNVRKAPLNKGVRNLYEGSTELRDYIMNSLLLEGEGLLRDAKNHSVIDMNIKTDDGKKATLRVTDGNVSVLGNNSDVDITVSGGIPQFLLRNSTSMIGG